MFPLQTGKKDGDKKKNKDEKKKKKKLLKLKNKDKDVIKKLDKKRRKMIARGEAIVIDDDDDLCSSKKCLKPSGNLPHSIAFISFSNVLYSKMFPRFEQSRVFTVTLKHGSLPVFFQAISFLRKS